MGFTPGSSPAHRVPNTCDRSLVTATDSSVSATTARNAVAMVFGLNGFCFATLVSRVPDLRASLDLSNGALGALLL